MDKLQSLPTYGNRGIGRNRYSFAEFDALPPPVRRTLAQALVCLGTRRARLNLLAGKSVAEVCAIERGIAAGLARREVLEADGPDHPFVSGASLHE